jgi:hypothetical protein
MMLIKKLKLGLMMAVVADIIALIFEYSSIQLGAFNLGCSAYNVVQLVLRAKY